ncbi:hypothetical protein FA15DRAFT_259268 [Coprinopsis marcescibilis]|uniref:Uncharacterized protein n=1 Tax=Coprinopsis marcescibilis TaxID=230819 RepID=A0A5C3L262_COPMA|nr:hypothetical protein FA15DRAFT_259268 [Coprinopsis marcescibilis]
MSVHCHPSPIRSVIALVGVRPLSCGSVSRACQNTGIKVAPCTCLENQQKTPQYSSGSLSSPCLLSRTQDPHRRTPLPRIVFYHRSDYLHPIPTSSHTHTLPRPLSRLDSGRLITVFGRDFLLSPLHLDLTIFFILHFLPQRAFAISSSSPG